MAVLESIPDVVDIHHYAGDTLTIKITAPEALVGGREWSGQIRDVRTDSDVGAEFQITEPTVAGGPAYVTLLSADSRRLVESGVLIRVARGPGQFAMILRYSGQWDVQVAGAGGVDPVTTLVQGSIVLDLDVTREDVGP